MKAARELARWQRTPRVQVVQAGAPEDAAGAPAAKKPQELGLKQFGHRIKKKPRCSVTIEIPETGEIYRFTP